MYWDYQEVTGVESGRSLVSAWHILEFSRQEADSPIPIQNSSRIYARYFRNTGRYLSPSPAEYAGCVQLILGKSSDMFYNRKEKLCSGGQKE